jgi:hypothetical protein
VNFKILTQVFMWDGELRSETNRRATLCNSTTNIFLLYRLHIHRLILNYCRGFRGL